MINDNTKRLRNVEKSIELNAVRYHCVIISANGVASDVMRKRFCERNHWTTTREGVRPSP